MCVGSTAQLSQVSIEMDAALAGRLDHRPEPRGLGFERPDLAVDAGARILEDRATLPGVVGGAESLAVALADRLVLQELTDRGQREAGLVSELLDIVQSLQVRGVVQAIGAIGARRRFEQAELFVVADRPGRQAGLGRDLLEIGRAHV